jgi:lambda repressor-like predicted transcriptional regulator
MFTRGQLKAQLKNGGWSYRSAAEALGCTYQHLFQVLAGTRTSERLMVEIAALPPREQWRKAHDQTGTH